MEDLEGEEDLAGVVAFVVEAVSVQVDFDPADIVVLPIAPVIIAHEFIDLIIDLIIDPIGLYIGDGVIDGVPH